MAKHYIDGFEAIEDDFLGIKEYGKWPIIISYMPFGNQISDKAAVADSEILKSVQSKRSKGIESEIIWLEQAHRLLADDGILITFLSENFLSANSLEDARRWLLNRFRLEALFSLPVSFLNPGTNMKINLVCFKKQSRPPEDYSIFMADLSDDDLDDLSSVVEAYRHFAEVGDA